MEPKRCVVSVTDIGGIEHSADVTAATLYEAVALALRAIKSNEWAGEIPEGLNEIRVSVTGIRVEHKLQIKQFNEWLDRPGRSPADMMHRKRVRELLNG